MNSNVLNILNLHRSYPYIWTLVCKLDPDTWEIMDEERLRHCRLEPSESLSSGCTATVSVVLEEGLTQQKGPEVLEPEVTRRDLQDAKGLCAYEHMQTTKKYRCEDLWE
jgi:hypothetical protein